MFSFSRKMDSLKVSFSVKNTSNLQEPINFCYLISAKPLLVKKKIIQFASNLFQSKI